MNTILVTGGSGFIGSHCILQLLTAGHQVRTTVRSLKREDEVRGMLKRGGLEPDNRLSFIAADLEADAGWAEAVAGCDYVLHVASPFPANIPGRDEELIGTCMGVGQPRSAWTTCLNAERVLTAPWRPPPAARHATGRRVR